MDVLGRGGFWYNVFMQYMAIDFGEKRTGLAIGDEMSRMATPLSTIHTGGEEERIKQIGRAIAENEPGALVVGLPLNMDGSDSPASLKCAAFAEVLMGRFEIDVYLVDERQTSLIADEQMAMSGLTRKQKKNRRDSLAAANILRIFFATHTFEDDGDALFE